MAWRIETDLQPDYLTIRILGSADAQVAGEIIVGVFREIATHNCSRLLVDVRGVDGRLGVLETFHIVSNYPAMQGLRAAILDRPENRSWFDFYETVSMNRGYHNRVFTDLEEATQWLVE